MGNNTRPYTVQDDVIILKCVKSSRTQTEGIKKAAKLLKRGTAGISSRFYVLKKQDAKIVNKQPKKAVKAQAPRKVAPTTKTVVINGEASIGDMNISGKFTLTF